MNVCLLAVEWKEHSVLFEDIKRGNANQCLFIGVPFMIKAMKWLDCAWFGSFHFCKEKQNGKK